MRKNDQGSESESCVGPDGEVCPFGCKLMMGDYRQDTEKDCNTDFFRGPDGYYMPNKARCPTMTCDGEEGRYTTISQNFRLDFIFK